MVEKVGFRRWRTVGRCWEVLDTEAADAEVDVLIINRWPNTFQTPFIYLFILHLKKQQQKKLPNVKVQPYTYTDVYCEGLRGFYASTERRVLRTHKQDAKRMITFSD